MTRSAPPRLATWLLERFAAGPLRESLIGDILEQYASGRSSTWYVRQALMIVFVALVILVHPRPRRWFRAFALGAVTVVMGLVGGTLALDLSAHNWLVVSIHLGAFGYCFAGVMVLVLTITSLDEPVSLRLVGSARD